MQTTTDCVSEAWFSLLSSVSLASPSCSVRPKCHKLLSHTCEWIHNLESRWLYSNLNSNIVMPKAGRNKRKLVVVVGKSYFQVIVSVNTLVELNKTICIQYDKVICECNLAKYFASAANHLCHNHVMRWNLMFKLGSVMPKHVIVCHILTCKLSTQPHFITKYY